MYQVAKQSALDILSAIGRKTPYALKRNPNATIILEGSIPNYSIIKIFETITSIYGTKILNKQGNCTINYKNESMSYLDHNEELKLLDLSMVNIKCHWKDVLNERVVFTINGFKMYEVIDNNLVRSLMRYLVDPVEYISHIKLTNNVPDNVMVFFETIQSNIKKMEDHNDLVLWVLKYSYISSMLVPDVLDSILKLYVESLLGQLDSLVDYAKMRLEI